ncbi:MAG: isochorismatase family protein [Propionibacteriales bacterium]|nr:isochorismatase family protein [Propionibacteriales bacterium]
MLVIDLQRQFTELNSPFVVDGADGLVSRTIEFADRARSCGAAVIWVRQVARPELGPGRATGRFRGGSSLHRGAFAELDPRIRIAPGDSEVVKRRQSAFFETDLDQLLRALGVCRVVITGVTTNVCCLATAIDAAARNYDVVACRDMTRALPIKNESRPSLTAEEARDNALAFIDYSCGPVVTSHELLGEGSRP